MQQRTPVAGPAFIRQLAQLLQLEVPACGQPLSERLSQWFDWNRAVALSRALDNPPAASASVMAGESVHADEYMRIREGLNRSIARLDDPASIAMPAPRKGADDAHHGPDYEPFRQHYLGLQRSMLAASGRLRGTLREVLAGAGADGARLAELDAVMEMTMSPREQALLASVPALLGEHFSRLRQVHAGPPVNNNAPESSAADSLNDAVIDAVAAPSDNASAASASPVTDDEAWLATFRRDMQDVLLAELDVRFQPIEGLLAALRHSQAMPS